ncbi:MAG: hybrid sensor histidine kinase/response regulator, partial [Proteobacteria bacterium]
DIVRSEASGLGGRVGMGSRHGRGTTFLVRLPLTLAVTQVVVLTTGGNTYAVPSVLVEQVQQLKTAPLADAYAQGGVSWRGEQVPLYFLSELLGDSSVAPVTQQYSPLLILKSGDMRVAVHVDEVVGNREVVVKNIGPQLARMPGVAGATVLGSGDIVLILDPVPLAQRLADAERAAPREEQAPQAPRSQPIVMVVDDSLTVRRVTQRLLTREGYQVMLAKDGVDALEQLQTVTPHLMLVDIEMPRMDGFDLTRNVRDDIRTRHIPIIMITSRTATKHRNYAMELGVNEYLGKPYRETDLLEFVAAYTRQEGLNAAGG